VTEPCDYDHLFTVSLACCQEIPAIRATAALITSYDTQTIGYCKQNQRNHIKNVGYRLFMSKFYCHQGQPCNPTLEERVLLYGIHLPAVLLCACVRRPLHQKGSV